MRYTACTECLAVAAHCLGAGGGGGRSCVVWSIIFHKRWLAVASAQGVTPAVAPVCVRAKTNIIFSNRYCQRCWFLFFFVFPIMRGFCRLVLKWNTPQQVVTANTEILFSARSAVPCTRWHFELLFLFSYWAGYQVATVDRSVRPAGTERCTLCPEALDLVAWSGFLTQRHVLRHGAWVLRASFGMK